MGETGGREMSEYTGKRLAEEWLGERDVDDEGGPIAELYLRCPHCGSTSVEKTNAHNLIKSQAYYCEECDAESLPI
jgi:hypothetical protein